MISGGVTISNNSFTMPAANVTVKAVFEKDGSTPPQPTRYSVTVQAGTGGTASASPASAEKGTKITLTATPDSGYHFKESSLLPGSTARIHDFSCTNAICPGPVFYDAIPLSIIYHVYKVFPKKQLIVIYVK